MKKAVLVSMLAVAFASAPYCVALTAVTVDGQQAGPQLSADEYAAYNAVISATDPAAKAAAGEMFVAKYPQSSVKSTVLEQMLAAYAATNNPPKTLDAADRLLVVDPSNIRALAIETSLLKSQGDSTTDAAVKSAAYAKAAGFASRGLKAQKPTGVEAADWAALTGQVTPYFYSAIGIDALNRKDAAAAIAAYTAELKAVPVAQTQAPGPFLQDTFFLGQAYYVATPPDYLSCAFYTTRTAAFAPDAFKAQFQPTATYCYKKFHGSEEGYDAVKTVAMANLFPPADFATSVKPAPTNEDLVKAALSGANLTTMALSDREFIIQYGTPAEADSVFASIKDKEVKIGGKLINATDKALMLAVSDDAKTANTADFSVMLKEAPKVAPAVGSMVEVVATFTSYTQAPPMLTMTGGEIAEKAPAKGAAAKGAAAKRPAGKPHARHK